MTQDPSRRGSSAEEDWWKPYQVSLGLDAKAGAAELRPIIVSETQAMISHLAASFTPNGRGRVWPGLYTGLYLDGELWMSDTPDEITDHMGAISEIERVGGRVLINGLGIGLVLAAALAVEGVEHVDVVEINRDVIDLVAPFYADPRVTIHHGDALDIDWPLGTRWNVIWSDIWPTITAGNLAEFEVLRTKYAAMADWHGFWAEVEVLAMAADRNAREGMTA